MNNTRIEIAMLGLTGVPMSDCDEIKIGSNNISNINFRDIDFLA